MFNVTQQPYSHISFFKDGSRVNAVVTDSVIEIDNTHNVDTDKNIDKNIEKNSIEYSYSESNITLTASVEKIDIFNLVVAIDALFACYDNVQDIVLPKVISTQVDIATNTATQQNHSRELTLYKGCATNSKSLELWCFTDHAHSEHVNKDIFYQSQHLWIVKDHATASPVCYQLHNQAYAPTRSVKPSSVVYQRFIPWLDSILTFETFSKSEHLPLFHKWMNDPAVDEFWEESGSLEKHEAYIDSKFVQNSHTVCLIARLDGKAFGYFEVYWAKEDRIAPYYDVNDFDRGWHVLIGEEAYRGKEFLTAWMPSMSHYMLLDDNRTQRLVIEPRIDNEKMKRSLGKCGYAHYKTFDFPHKRAMLGMTSREQFFMSHVLVPLCNT